ncbi:hypothetical protein [Parashewanella curva]|uniref:hypothetical protein n=1 Tax=Parashewanella curva TaxID=2338552 RepID=UPI001059AE9C|nr:hypothetical protein [Parashewanella curva]
MSLVGVEGYGVYTAAISVTTWMFLFDFGVAKGARNVITKALIEKDFALIRKTVLITYTVTALVVLVMIGFFYFLVIYFDALKIEAIKNETLFILLVTCVVYFLFSIVDQLNYAVHKGNLVFVNSFFVAFINVVLIKFFYQDVTVDDVVILFCLSKVAPYIFSSVYFFVVNIDFRVGFTVAFDWVLLKRILSNSIFIILIQLLFLLMIGLDRIILLNCSSGTEVAKYDILYRVMGVVMLPYSLLVSPLWATLKKVLEDKDWKKFTEIKYRFHLLLAVAVFLLVLVVISFDWIVGIWLTQSILIDFYSKALMAVLFVCFIYCGFYTDMYFSFEVYKVLAFSLVLSLFLKYMYIYMSNEINAFAMIFSSVIGYMFLSVYFMMCNNSVSKGKFGTNL